MDTLVGDEVQMVVLSLKAGQHWRRGYDEVGGVVEC